MSSNCLRVLPYSNYNSSTNSQQISFCAIKNPLKEWHNPIKPLKKNGPFVNLPNISQSVSRFIEEEAYKKGLSNDAYLRLLTKNISHISKILPVDSKSVIIGNTRVSTLIDGGQYFKKAIDFLKGAEINPEKGIRDAILIKGFEFQNLKIDGDKWATLGAEKVPGAKEQQQLLGMILKKRQAYPDMKIQMQLDAHKWYIDSHGRRRHYNNAEMIRFLKQNNIDVIPAPRASQQGSMLEHDKLLAIVDEKGVKGKRVLLGGMNMGTHSAANHDFCVSVESLPNKKSSEVDNIIQEHFVTPWKFAWHRLGETNLVTGPLNEAEQKNFNGVRKEILEENVTYHNLLSEFFDTPEMRNRYKEGRLDLIEIHPVANPKINVLTTRPKEYENIGSKGSESIREYNLEKLQTATKVRGEFFYNPEPEFIDLVIKRFEAGELDAAFVIEGERFPYCENAYDKLVEHKVPIRIYKGDKETKQRMHGKVVWYDDKYIAIGSANWSSKALTQNLGKGFRDDYPLVNAAIDERIQNSIKKVKEHEDKLKIPNMQWDGSRDAYQELKTRLSILRKAYTQLKNKGETTIDIGGVKSSVKADEMAVTVEGKTFPFKKTDQKDARAELRTILGYYGIMKRRQLSKPKYKRGNSEMAIAFESPSLAKSVFGKQFTRDWDASESDYDRIKHKLIPIKRLNVEG